MSMEPLTNLSPAVALHLCASILALLLGPWALYRKRRDVWHKALGYVWVASMLTVSVSSFFLASELLPLVFGYGPIHLLSIWVPYIVLRAVQAARQGDIRRHQGIMRNLYWTALLLTGAFTLLPYRTLNRALFPENPGAGVWVVAALVVALAIAWLLGRRRARPEFA